MPEHLQHTCMSATKHLEARSAVDSGSGILACVHDLRSWKNCFIFSSVVLIWKNVDLFGRTKSV